MIGRSIRALVLMLFWVSAESVPAHAREVPIIYPKDHSVVYDKVNLVLDPTDIPFFQVLVGATEYPIVDTSAGRHAYQGLALKPGVNTITVRVFTASPDPNNEELALVASREISVFSRVGLFTKGAIPAGFKEVFFHSRERETSCSGCHTLEIGKDAPGTSNDSEEAICSPCHRTMPVGSTVHYPAAVWKCIVCHDPNLYPVKYQFTQQDPWTMTKSRLPIKPEAKDRERIVVNLEYAQGVEIDKLQLLVKIPKGAQYVKGSAMLGGRPKDPAIAGENLVWDTGNRGANFSKKLSFVMKKEMGSSPGDPEIRARYSSDGSEITRDFTPTGAFKNLRMLEEACNKCHTGMVDGKFGHEPASAGACNICHNPHASSAPSLLREPSWLLCTHCHTDKSSGVHVLTGIESGSSHPTKGDRDPLQPDKQFSCVSCHNPHSANNKTLFTRNAGSLSDLCQKCHPK